MWNFGAFKGRPDEWDALCSSFEDFTPTQSYAWGAARAEEGWTPLRHVWHDDRGDLVAVATVLARRRFGMQFLYISRGPLVRRAGLTREEVERRFRVCLDSYRRKLHWGGTLVCAIHVPLADLGPEALAASGLLPLFPTHEPHGISSTIALTTPEVLPRCASSDWRNRFRRSEALIAEVRSSNDAEKFLAARRLVAALERTKGFTTTITTALLQGLSASGSMLFYVEDATGRMTAAVLLAVAGRRVFRLMAGVDPEALRRHPGVGRVLEVAATRWAHAAGFREYDLEGLNPTSRGVWDFKIGMKGNLFAGGGLHAASRPRILARAYSYYARGAWRTPVFLWRSAPGYFIRVVGRTLSSGRVDFRRMRLYVRDLTSIPAAENRVGFTFLDLEKFDPAEFRYRLSTVRELWRRTGDLSRGVRECCVLLGPDGYAVGYGFLAWNHAAIPEIGAELPLSREETYIYDCVIIPQFRGKKLYRYLLDHMCAHAKRRGASRVRIAVDAGNLPSVRGIEGAGFKCDREVLYRRVLGWRELRWHLMST